MRWLHFILSHSIFIAFCALALCYQTFTLLQVPHNVFVYALVFFSTLCSYNFYWLLSKFSFSDRKLSAAFVRNNRTYILLGIIAGLGMAYALYFLPAVLVYVLPAAAFTILYSLPLWPFSWAAALRRAGVFKTLLLAFTWAYVTVIIPAIPELHSDTSAVMALLVARFFFVGMLCAIFDRRDAAVDKIRGLHSLATAAGKRSLALIMIISFVIYMASGIFVRLQFTDNAQMIAFIITGLAVALVYRLSLQKQGYLFYYFVVDGMMLFSAAATFIATLC